MMEGFIEISEVELANIVGGRDPAIAKAVEAFARLLGRAARNMYELAQLIRLLSGKSVVGKR